MEFVKLFVESGLFLDEIRHGAVSAVFCIFLYKKTGKIFLSLFPLAFTYLIDFDHVIDYMLYHGIRFDPVQYITFSYYKFTSRATVLLHAWEWLAILSVWAYKKRTWESWQAVLAISLLSHLVWDSYTVGNPVFYSILYRAANGFVIM